jgi:Coenzyme PQQ synthesis protein D (PqqD)
MLTLDRKLRPHPDAVDTELDKNEMVLLHLETKTYYSLNSTGLRIWQGLKRGLPLRDISRLLQDEFQVDAESADRSVLELVTELAEQKLVESVE